MSSCWRRSLRSAVLLVVLAGCVVPAALATGLALAPGDRAPMMRGDRPGGEVFKVDYSAHKITVINYWAVWCVPCKDEMPELQALYEKHAESGLLVVGVVKGNDPDAALQEFCGELGVRYPVIRPHKGIVPMWQGVGVLPTTFLIDSDGKVLRRYVGATAEQIAGLAYDIEAALEGRPLGPFIMPETPAISTDDDRKRMHEIRN